MKPALPPANKPAGKRAVPSAAMMPQAHGGALLTGGVPGNAGGRNGGRPPEDFKLRMREIASSDAALEYLDQCVRGVHGSRAAISAQQYVADRGYGNIRFTSHGGADEPRIIELVREYAEGT